MKYRSSDLLPALEIFFLNYFSNIFKISSKSNLLHSISFPFFVCCIDLSSFLFIAEGYVDAYITEQGYHPLWKLIIEEQVRPGMRGGHQMCFDAVSETIFLLGGWNGHQDLSDLWSYHVPSNKWKLISYDVEAEVS